MSVSPCIYTDLVVTKALYIIISCVLCSSKPLDYSSHLNTQIKLVATIILYTMVTEDLTLKYIKFFYTLYENINKTMFKMDRFCSQ